jgi:hypothetical protein
MPKYVIIAAGDTEQIVLGPFSDKNEAIDRAVRIVESVDTFSTRQEIEDGLRANSRNDVAIGRLSPPNAGVRS